MKEPISDLAVCCGQRNWCSPSVHVLTTLPAGAGQSGSCCRIRVRVGAARGGGGGAGSDEEGVAGVVARGLSPGAYHQRNRPAVVEFC